MDLFDATASDSEEEECDEVELATLLRRMVSERRRRNLRVRCIGESDRATALLAALEVTLDKTEKPADVVIVADVVDDVARLDSLVARGGLAAVLSAEATLKEPFARVEWRGGPWSVFRRRVAVADAVGCPPWGPAKGAEHDRAESVAVVVDDSALEERAGATLRAKGLVILPGFFADQASIIDETASFALDRFEELRLALIEHHSIDLSNPGDNGQEPQSYREIAMREDFRCDIRLDKKIIGENHHLSESLDEALEDRLAAVRRIARHAASAPTSEDLRSGNFGRWNFDDKGPLAPRPLPMASSLGAVISLPGAADQALHADTPHLFDHVSLPGHYFNLFLGSAAADRDASAGHTAFILETHDLATCAKVLGDQAEPPRQEALAPRLVRPRLGPGDALIFDARILHFGLPNRSTHTRRPMLYWNIHDKWFQDPKNWDDSRSVFTPDNVTTT